MRTKRALLVGDPMQIEPVVTLPDTLTQTICHHFEVNPVKFNAPQASAQTLADAACSYCTIFDGNNGYREIGIPLLVHRRCNEPMFGIANTIAYEKLMVNAKAKKFSAICECLGPSAWFHIASEANEKWSFKEGQMVLRLLHRLKDANVSPNLYIVTPFRIIAANLRRLIRENAVINEYTENYATGWYMHHIGTVHTVQGREAEAVIFVLGAPDEKQIGARKWAGRRPNLLNVAVTRAKEVLYVIGNRQLWKKAGLFQELDCCMPETEIVY